MAVDNGADESTTGLNGSTGSDLNGSLRSEFNGSMGSLVNGSIGSVSNKPIRHGVNVEESADQEIPIGRDGRTERKGKLDQ